MNCKISNAQLKEVLVTALSEESQANAARLTQAMTTVFTGSPSKPTTIGGMGLGVTFAGNDEQNKNICRRQAALGYSQLYIVLDLDNPFGLPVRFDIVYVDVHCAIQFQDCKIWAPASGGNTMIALGDGDSGFFRFKTGHPLAFRKAKLPGSFEVGNQRAMNRFYENLAKLPAPNMQKFMLSINA